MKHLFLILVALILVSCASIKPVKFVGPNGSEAYTMKCSGLGRTLEKCYVKAGQVCPSGYNVVNRSSSTVATTINGQLLAAPQHNLTIECKS